MPTTLRTLLPAAFILLLVTTLAYLPALSGGFLFDDYPNIVHNQQIQVDRLDAESLGEAASAYGGPLGRPLATITIAMDHAVWGSNPFGYKLTGLLVHLANVMLVFALTRRLLPAMPGSTLAAIAPAAALTLAWSIHPLQVSTVAYIVQRMEMMALSFVLLGLLAYLRGRRLQAAGMRGWPWVAGAFALAAAGLLCKETAALFPAYALALELTVLRFAASSPSTSRLIRATYAVSVAAALLVFFLALLPEYVAPEVYAIRDYGPGERLLTQLRVLPTYLFWIVLPQPGSYLFYYDHLQASQGIMEPVTTLLGGIFLVVLAALAWMTRHRMPLLSLGLMWFFASHSLTSNVFPLELVFEHRNYFSILAVLLAVTDLVLRLPASEIPKLRPAAVGIVLVGFLALTLIRSATWGDSLHLAMSLAERNPESSRASMDLGEQYMIRAGNDPSSRFYALAEAEFERGSRVPNASPMPEQGLVVLAATAGQPAKPEWWDRIVFKLRNRAIGPQELGMITGMLRMRQQGVGFDDARFAEAYLVLVERMDMPPSQYYAFAEHALTMLGDKELAIQLYKVALDQGDAEFAAAVVEALIKTGHPDVAREIADYAAKTGRAVIELPAESAE